jgi:hypothetical protein
MTCCSMFIGDLHGFDWQGDWNGNLPGSLTSPFPPVRDDHYHSKFDEWVEKAGVFHAQTDFDGFVARVTKAQILEFIEFCYGSDSSYTDPDRMLRSSDGKAFLVEKLDRLKVEVAALDDGIDYGLVSECF